MSGKVKEEHNLEDDANESLNEENDIKYHDIKQELVKEEDIDGKRISI